MNSGIAARIAMTMHEKIGVCNLGCTRDRAGDIGKRLSRAMPKHRRIVAVMMLRQQTRIAADTTAR